jgi:membrane protease subunit HflK
MSDLVEKNYNESNQGPPDLEEIFKRFIRPKSGKSSTNKEEPASGGGNSGGGDQNRDPWGRKKAPELSPRALVKIMGWVLLAIVVLWIFSGFFIVKPAERAAILRFGQYIETVGPGPHWVPAGIETVNKLNVDQVSSVQLNALMLTQEENIVSVQFVAQFKINDLEDYLFNVDNPVDTLGQSLDSAVRQVIGHSVLNDILTTGRAAIADKVRLQLQALMDQYKTGIEVVDVTMQPASAPEPVKDAFDDVIKAREDKVRSSNEAMGYANQVIPVAKGQANQMIQLAKAGASQSVNNAKAEVAGFEALLPQYLSSPLVTQTRLYFETLEKVLSTNQVIVASDSGKNMIYLSPFSMTGSSNSSQNTLPPMPSVGSGSGAASNSVAPSFDSSYSRWKQTQGPVVFEGENS